ncbi:SagB/ThcOx family dehydrogenase [Pseudomonas sp. RTC3]|uniref:SagB/ThcOx family dehydrogenase n=1 Tax=Pseudomonas sp. 5C2 TaxID=3048588 RepID=UPI002AB42BF6|nr:SagB/ThcOx family dehydrogenase [Pseudomonas sp. 5C2]MDY7565008.1 SagB/ThcOx family dehydrogenase [Pseudomonas sp. 5C2]MEB0063855.1 SagB/ThcOx family dehydrogenase [Pseudomonas sp. RTC3]MEB0242207.1 SagB/ThcOx family dehydrogenase [Pseudomonas sp. 5C2]
MTSRILTGAAEAAADEAVVAYHERTKHHFHRYAAALGYMDWATQPDPFRRYAGAELVRLPLPKSGRPLAYWQLYASASVPPLPLSLASVSLFFRYALSLTAWKQSGDITWPLRVNPSSGNLHPTEGYALLPAIEQLGVAPALYHYAPKEHALERRAALTAARWSELTESLPAGSFLVGLSSVHWREAWKYGERAYRYCQHDVGHALASLRIAAAALGWKLLLIDNISDSSLSNLLGLDRDEDFTAAERENADLLAVISPNIPGTDLITAPLRESAPLPQHGSDVLWQGRANPLSRNNRVEWPAIDTIAQATRRAASAPIQEDFVGFAAENALFDTPIRQGRLTAEQAILGRRSAVAMDGATAISRATLFAMLGRLLPTQERSAMPWDAISWRPRIHLGLFVHRVDGLVPGLYALVRDPHKVDSLKRVMHADFLWQRVPDCPPGLPLYLLREGDCRAQASAVSCGQNIAADGAFSVAMLADYMDSLATYGGGFYRNLFWEAGMLGQVLYLEAEEAGIRATGIGCYFDDPVHAAFGIDTREWQSFYHFTVGGPVEDNRLTTLPACDFE